jgi:hypothetical protein
VNPPVLVVSAMAALELTGRKTYGHAPSLDEAKAAFKAEYVAWRNEG